MTTEPKARSPRRRWWSRRRSPGPATAIEPEASSATDSGVAADSPDSSDSEEAADAPATNPPDGFTPKVYWVPEKTRTAHVRSR